MCDGFEDWRNALEVEASVLQNEIKAKYADFCWPNMRDANEWPEELCAMQARLWEIGYKLVRRMN